MFRHFVFLISFLFTFEKMFSQDVSQDSDNKPEFTFSPDQSLKSITSYNINESDSTMTNQWIYSNGKLIKMKTSDQDITDFFYEDKYNVSSIKGNVLNKYIFDQYGNLFYKRIFIDKKDSGNFICPTFEFRNYVYKDSLMTFCNIVMSQTIYTEERSEKYEYDKNKKLKKVFYKYQTYQPYYYKLAREFFYNTEGQLIKSLGNPLDLLAGGRDSTLYTYNSKNQLTEEISHSILEKSTIRYYYNQKGLLISVVEISDWYNATYRRHYYLEY